LRKLKEGLTAATTHDLDSDSQLEAERLQREIDDALQQYQVDESY